MTSQKRSLMGRIYRAYRAFFEPLHRGILPLSTGVSVLPKQSLSVKGRVQSDGFWPDHLTISNAGTEHGAADWVVNDIRIAGRSQFLQAGDLPGDMFATNAVDSFMRFEVAKASMEVEIIVTYMGTNEKGCPFFASITGMEYDPGLLDIVREAISQALGSASRGLSTRPH
jgi:hypothetical protein